MAKSENQKKKLLYLYQIFMRDTDDKHGLSLMEITAKLAELNIKADRKTLYQDFKELSEFGMDIVSVNVGKHVYYHVGARQFELPELKLLVDSVQAAKFITDSKSKALIRKLESLGSTYEADQLQRQVVMAGRVKTVNKSVYNNVDTIYDAIGVQKQIRFHYFQWDRNGRAVLRHDGAWYQVSPWCLMWDDEYYYLVAYSSSDNSIRHYRVDKMKDLSVTEDPREGKEAFKQFDVAKYSKSVFGMFSGEEKVVTMECDNSMAGVMIDRFGKDVSIHDKDEDHFIIHVNVVPSGQFLGWVFGLGEKVKIIGPQSVVDQMKEETKRLVEQYLNK